MAGKSNSFADIITKKPGGKKAMKNMKRNSKRSMKKGGR
jgi:hypothetical protein